MLELTPGSKLWNLYIYYKSVGGYPDNPQEDAFWSFLAKITVISLILTLFSPKSPIYYVFFLFCFIFSGIMAKTAAVSFIILAFWLIFDAIWREKGRIMPNIQLGKTRIRLW